jgi:outer membrane protein TolC/ketosteroid isomerase-like protein
MFDHQSKARQPRRLSPPLRPRSIMALTTALLFSGCASIKPEPLTTPEVISTSTASLSKLRANMAPLSGPLTLEEAIARSIKYNLDRRVKMMEEALARGQVEVSRYDMLPKLVASAGYKSRDNDLITRSTDSVTGQPSLSHPYVSSERSAATADLAFTWSLLDFGQSYYAARQGANRALVTGERRRKAMHLLLQDVRTAFWRAACAQKLKSSVEASIADADAALEDSRKVEAERIRSPLEALRYQRQLLENLRLLESVNQELSSARIELASLTGLPMSGDLKVVEPSDDVATRWLSVPAEHMEQQAIAQNADLRESFYNVRLATDEARRGLLRMFPGLSFNYGMHNSSDSYLINSSWNDAGAQLGFNLFGALAIPSQQRQGKSGQALAEGQRLATLMSVMTQVHLARLQLGNAYRQFQRADSIWKVDRSISDQMTKREQVETQSRMDRIANQTSAILSELRRYQSLAQVQAAASKLQATLGLEPAIQGDQDMSVAQLTQAVRASMKQWDDATAFGGDPQPAPTVKPALPMPVAMRPQAAPAPAVMEPRPSGSDASSEVDRALQSWLSGWKRRDTDAYLSTYGDAFVPPNGMTRHEWAKSRAKVIKKARRLNIAIEDVNIAIQGGNVAEVTFVQHYRSTHFQETSHKVLQWQKVNDQWQIVREASIDGSQP